MTALELEMKINEELDLWEIIDCEYDKITGKVYMEIEINFKEEIDNKSKFFKILKTIDEQELDKFFENATSFPNVKKIVIDGTDIRMSINGVNEMYLANLTEKVFRSFFKKWRVWC